MPPCRSAEECKERAEVTPAEERRPQAWVQRVLLCTKGRAVSLHTTHEITPQVGARLGSLWGAVGGLAGGAPGDGRPG